MRLPGAHAENPVDNFRKVYWGNSPSVARGTAGEPRRMTWQKWRSERAKKEAPPKRDFLAIHGHPCGRSAGAPEQATPNYNSANVRECQGLFSAPGNGAEKGPGQPKADPVNGGRATTGHPLQNDD